MAKSCTQIQKRDDTLSKILSNFDSNYKEGDKSKKNKALLKRANKAQRERTQLHNSKQYSRCN